MKNEFHHEPVLPADAGVGKTTSRTLTKDSEVIDLPDGSLSGDYQDKGLGAREKDFSSKQLGEVMPTLIPEFWQAGKQQAQKAFGLYANIDILRPYFHVEPQEVRDRIFESLIPKRPSHYSALVIPGELYGPLMLVFTLIALLLYGMKSSGHVVKEGTLMGTAFGVSFGYWLGASAFVNFLSYVCNTHITFLQILSVMGYALSGHCLALLFGSVFHPVHSHIFFYSVWLIFGGITALKLVSVFMARTTGSSQRMIVCGAAASLHLLMLLYFHFAYHATVEAIDSIEKMI